MEKSEIQERTAKIMEYLGYSRSADPVWIRKNGPMAHLPDTVPLYDLHNSFPLLIGVLMELGEGTGYELKIGWEECYWNRDGHDPGIQHTGYGYGTTGIFQAVSDFVDWIQKPENEEYLNDA